jgi:hypothetical protein
MKFRFCMPLTSFLLMVSGATISAYGESQNNEFLGDFYNPTWDGGCYQDGLVYHVSSNKIILLSNKNQSPYIENLKVTNDQDKFTIEGVPSTNDQIKKKMKKIIITYKSVEDGYQPVAMTVDDKVLSAQDVEAKNILENYYSLRSCAKPSFMGWLLLSVGWHTAYQ